MTTTTIEVFAQTWFQKEDEKNTEETRRQAEEEVLKGSSNSNSNSNSNSSDLPSMHHLHERLHRELLHHERRHLLMKEDVVVVKLICMRS